MTEQLPSWPRDVTRVSVTPEHVRAGKAGSLTESAAALAISDAIGPEVAVVSVDVDITTAHEKRAPYRWWYARTPGEIAALTGALDGWDCDGEVAEAARLGLLDFELTWNEGEGNGNGNGS